MTVTSQYLLSSANLILACLVYCNSFLDWENNFWIRLDAYVNVSLSQVMFICNHCPFVIHLKEDIVKLAANYMPVKFLA